MRQILLAAAMVALLVIGFFLYRSRSSKHLQVTPEAAREIEKAKSR